MTPVLRLYAANLDWATGPTKDARHLSHLLAAVSWAVLIGVQEAKNVRLRDLVDLPGRAFQRTFSAAVRGSGFVARGIRVRRFRLFLGGVSRATLPRWVARCKVRVPGGPLAVFSSHPPPKRAGTAAQDRHLRALRRRLDRRERRGKAWAVCIDGNRDLQEVARFLGGRGYGAEGDRIVGVIVSDRVVVVDHGVDRVGRREGLTDHLVPYVDIAGVR